MQEFAEIARFLPYLIPVIVIEMGLLLVALFDLLKREPRVGKKWMWLLVILFIQLFGPIIYFIFGRGEESSQE